MMFNKILVALDRSSEASAVFDNALSVALPETSEMLLLHFIDWQVQNVSPWVGVGTLYDMNVSSDRYNWSRQNLQTEVEQGDIWLQNFVDKAITQGINCQSECRIGNCNLGITNIAKSWNADLIVIGRRGRRNISEILLGSVSNYVVHHAPCSVFVVQGEEVLEMDNLATTEAQVSY